MLHSFPLEASLRAVENAVAEGQFDLLGGLGCILAESAAPGAADAARADVADLLSAAVV